MKGCEMLVSDAVNSLAWEDWQSLEKRDNIHFETHLLEVHFGIVTT